MSSKLVIVRVNGQAFKALVTLPSALERQNWANSFTPEKFTMNRKVLLTSVPLLKLLFYTLFSTEDIRAYHSA